MLSRHLETCYAACGGAAAVCYRRQLVKTPDNDEVAVDAVCGLAHKPLLVIFHGLEGSAQSGSVRRLAAYFGARGWNVAIPHFRTCGGLMNHQPRAYHAADAAEVDWMLRFCAGAFAHSGFFAAGISLGGNALIHWAAKCGNGKYDNAGICALATISAPFDLAASVRAMSGGINRLLYEKHFMKTLRAKIRQKQKQNPEWFANGNIGKAQAAIDNAREVMNKTTTGKAQADIGNARDIGKAQAANEANDKMRDIGKAQAAINKMRDIDIGKVRTLAEFDECYTAPVHGFTNAADYWQQGSCGAALQNVKLPLLCINAQNDPIVPPSSLPNPSKTPANIRHNRPKKGAHAAFTGTPPDWLPRQLCDFFTNHNPEKPNMQT